MNGVAEEDQLRKAYSRCSSIARSEARNFYYAFRALPKRKRDAICAVYAFMRRADDIADDDCRPSCERRRELDQWRASWHGAIDSGGSADPVLLALLDVHRRFGVPAELFDQLVEGTAADLAPAGACHGKLAGFHTFGDLYRYCYLVASVVGLVSIRIFGYSGPEAEKLAEETGIAFQLTNILRDVREDAARGRMYLPLEDLDRCGVRPEDLVSLAPKQALTDSQRRVLAMTAERAERYYRSSQSLIPLISSDSRPALWVLVSIYHRLLRRIENRKFDVFSSRVSVPAWEKLAWMSGGIGKLLIARLGAGS